MMDQKHYTNLRRTSQAVEEILELMLEQAAYSGRQQAAGWNPKSAGHMTGTKLAISYYGTMQYMYDAARDSHMFWLKWHVLDFRRKT